MSNDRLAVSELQSTHSHGARMTRGYATRWVSAGHMTALCGPTSLAAEIACAPVVALRLTTPYRYLTHWDHQYTFRYAGNMELSHTCDGMVPFMSVLCATTGVGSDIACAPLSITHETSHSPQKMCFGGKTWRDCRAVNCDTYNYDSRCAQLC